MIYLSTLALWACSSEDFSNLKEKQKRLQSEASLQLPTSQNSKEKIFEHKLKICI